MASSHDATVTTHFEFFGPYIGPVGILVGLPLLVWASAFYCNQTGWPSLPMRLPTMREVSDSFSLHVFLVYVAWWSFQAFLHVVVPGPTAEGVLLRDGSRLKYRINGGSLRQSVAFDTLRVTMAAAQPANIAQHVADSAASRHTPCAQSSLLPPPHIHPTSASSRPLLLLL
jgi:hypothetical protein